MKINPFKSADLSLGPKHSTYGSSFNNEPLTQAGEKTLGVIISSNLSWNKHIDSLLTRSSSGVTLCKILSYRHHLPSAIVKRFCLAFVRPKLEYCSAVWCGASSAGLKRLEKVQISVARAIARRRESAEALSVAGLPTLSWRRHEHSLVLLWKVVNGMGPLQLEKLLPLAASGRSTCSLRVGHELQFTFSRTARRLYSFLCVVVPVWNSLPARVVSCKSLSLFRHRLHDFFVSDMYQFGLYLASS